MRERFDIGPSLADEGRGSHREESAPRNRKPPKRADRSADGDEAVEIWNRAVAAIGSQKVAAAELGISDSHLSDYCAGRRTVALHRVVLLCRRAGARQVEQAAALRILTDLALMAGLAPPSLPRKVSRRDAKDGLATKLHSIKEIYALMRVPVAADLGTTPEDLDAAMNDEPTNPRLVMP
jgi:hypothetical protein